MPLTFSAPLGSLWATNTPTQQLNQPFILGITIFECFQVPSQCWREGANSHIFMQTGARGQCCSQQIYIFFLKCNLHNPAVYHKYAVKTKPNTQLDPLQITVQSRKDTEVHHFILKASTSTHYCPLSAEQYQARQERVCSF